MKYKIIFLIISVFMFQSCHKEINPIITKITPEKYTEIVKNVNKKTIIHFWFSYCAPCIEDYPELDKLAKENNIELIHISSDMSDSKMQENLEKVMQKLKIKKSYIIDYDNLYPNGTKKVNVLGDFAKQIGLKDYNSPYYILLDKKGNVVIESYELEDIKGKVK